jgi:transcriptional regulator with XRE-family HTH domain
MRDTMVARIGPKRPRRQFLKQWRESRGLTQQQLAERLETGKDQISRWESGKRGMTAEVIEALSDALQIEPGDIFRDPAMPSADQLLRNATPEQRQQALSVIEALLKTGTRG